MSTLSELSWCTWRTWHIAAMAEGSSMRVTGAVASFSEFEQCSEPCWLMILVDYTQYLGDHHGGIPINPPVFFMEWDVGSWSTKENDGDFPKLHSFWTSRWCKPCRAMVETHGKGGAEREESRRETLKCGFYRMVPSYHLVCKPHELYMYLCIYICIHNKLQTNQP